MKYISTDMVKHGAEGAVATSGVLWLLVVGFSCIDAILKLYANIRGFCCG